LTLILAIVVLAVSVSPALAQVVAIPSLDPSVDPSLEPPCLYAGPVEAAIADFVELTPCDLRVVSD
jgi:hypothetical protein